MKLTDRRISTVLFDADGTLLDNLPVLTTAVRRSILKILGHSVTDDEVLIQARRSLPDYLSTLLPADCADPAALLQAVRADFESRYAEHAGEVSLFEGIKAMLDALVGDYRLGVVSSRQTRVRDDLARLAITQYFEVVIDRDETDRHKPDPEPLLLACDRLGISPEQAIYVGDAPADVLAAQAAGMLSIAVLYGGNNLNELLEVQPDYLATSPAAIVNLLAYDAES